MRCLMLGSLLLSTAAVAGEQIACEPQPINDGREWHYRTKIDGRPDKCFYVGEKMKPRSELSWQRSHGSPLTGAASEGGQRDELPAFQLVPAPAFAEGSFEDRWQGITTAWESTK